MLQTKRKIIFIPVFFFICVDPCDMYFNSFVQKLAFSCPALFNCSSAGFGNGILSSEPEQVYFFSQYIDARVANEDILSFIQGIN